MNIHTLAFSPTAGWSTPQFPNVDSERTLILAFGASNFLANPAPFLELQTAFPTSTIVGCSTSGEIHGEKLRDETISVAIAQFEHTKLAMSYARIESTADSFVSGVGLANRLDRRGLRCAFVLSEGMVVNGSELIRGLNSIFADEVILTGGIAGDMQFSKTWILKDGLPVSGYACALGFYGDQLVIGHGSDGGWSKFGPERVVTRSQGNVLYELDGRPALDIYREYLGDQAANLPAAGLFFPLSIRTGESDEKQYVRTVVGIHEEDLSLIFGGDIPQGSIAQLMYGSIDRLVDGAQNAADMADCCCSDQVLGVAISCAARRRVMSERTEEEIEAVLSSLPLGSVLTGFYSFGEISPCCNGRADLHNQTMALTTFTEAA
jgi:hypothetical protein